MRPIVFLLVLTLGTPAFAKPTARLVVKTGSPVTSLSYAPDGRKLASGDEDGRVALVDTKSGKITQSFRYKASVSAIAFAPNGKLIAVGVGKQVRLLNPLSDMKTAKPVRVLEASTPLGDTLQFSADGRVLLVLEGDYSRSPHYVIEIWDANSGKKLRTYSLQEADNYAAALSPDGKTFVAENEKSGRSLFSVATGKKICALSDHFTADTPPFEVPIMSTLSWSPDGKWIASTGSYFEAAGHLTLWEAASGAMKWSRTFYDFGNALAWSPDSSHIAVGTSYETDYDEPGKLHRPTGAPIFGTSSGRWQRSVQRAPSEVNALAWSPDGKTLATANKKGLQLWKMNE